jgi:hypothetical protein
MDEDAIADSRVREPVRLIQPVADGARSAVNTLRKRLEVNVIFEKIEVGHCAALRERMRLQENLRTNGWQATSFY